MNIKELLEIGGRNSLFWLSRKINYPLLPPDTAQINFTFRCNLRCKMCNMYDHMQLLKGRGERVEIDSETFRKIIKESAGLGIKNIIFIGGEPFIREDLFDLVGYAKRLGLAVTIISNGVLLDSNAIEGCFAYGVDCLNISIDAARDETFDRIRGKGVLKSIIENISNLNLLKEKRKSWFPAVSAICTIMNDNLEELSDVVSLCKRLKIANISFQPVVINNANQCIRDFNSSAFIPPSRLAVLDESINKLIDYKRDNPDFISNGIRHLALIKKYFSKKLFSADTWPCYAGYNRLQITQDYVMYFCIPHNDKYKSSFGDVSKMSLKDLWYSRDARIRRRLIKKCSTPCLQCCSYRHEFVKFSDGIKSFLNRLRDN